LTSTSPPLHLVAGSTNASPASGLRIPFNRPFLVGKELSYIAQALAQGQIAADGPYTKRCSRFLEERFGVHRVLLTPSGTAALEMAALLCDLGPGDEALLPSFTFVSTAAAIARTGARPVFVDLRADTLNLDESKLEAAIGPRTKLIVPVHYAGVACDMDAIMAIADRHGLRVLEDAALALGASCHGRALGSIGHFGAFSFHETKNLICGEGGALCLNDPQLMRRAEIIRDKGTNRQQFFRGEIDKYTWVDVGSSYVPSELSSAFLWAQLEQLDAITERRRVIYRRYQDGLLPLEQAGLVRLPWIPPTCQSNYHMFYLLLPTPDLRDRLMAHLKANGIGAVFHYIPLHNSPFGRKLGGGQSLPVTEDASARLLRLPLYVELAPAQQDEVIDQVTRYLREQA
jgi:dTDP-4-amino-4,6-dideoxygalactose transaminase